MRIKAVLIAGGAMLISSLADAADDVDITKGRLTHAGPYAVQTIQAQNNTGRAIEWLGVQCGFFKQGSLLTSGEGATQNLGPGQKAYFDVRGYNSSDADSADCRVTAAK